MEMDAQQHPTEQTVRALVQRSHRGPNDLTLTTDRRRPTPGVGDYLIRVGAAGINFADVMQSHGTYGGGPQAPYVAGFKPPARSWVLSARTSRARCPSAPMSSEWARRLRQYMTMPAAGVFPVPSGWSDAEALGLVLNWATALAALKPRLGEDQGR